MTTTRVRTTPERTSVPKTDWKKSRHSNPSGNCVETLMLHCGVLVRDSQDPEGGTLLISHEEWAEMLGRIK
jgi:hypothetical protein